MHVIIEIGNDIESFTNDMVLGSIILFGKNMGIAFL